MFDLFLSPLIVGLAAISLAAYIIRWILKHDAGPERLQQVGGYIIKGTRTYLNRQTKTILLVTPIFAVLMYFLYSDWRVSVVFVFGVVLSLIAGYIGMNVAVRTNMRSANASRKSSALTFRLSFLGGAVTGLLVTGIALLGLFFLRLAFSDISVLVGFGFGASLAALFAQDRRRHIHKIGRHWR